MITKDINMEKNKKRKGNILTFILEMNYLFLGTVMPIFLIFLILKHYGFSWEYFYTSFLLLLFLFQHIELRRRK